MIKILDPVTISKIAAGEVVERPLSVVKELIENAIDAGATEITVTLEDGGHKLIRVSDNGCGMNDADAVLCIKSHSTSKLRDVADLESIHTLGFRGEALNSMGAVSYLTVTTCAAGSDSGVIIKVEGGIEKPAVPAARPQGTTIEVANLFFNVPARRKFLKSARAEASAIVQLVEKFIIAYPAVAFRVDNNSSQALSVPPSQEFIDRITYIMGGNISASIVTATGSRGVAGLTAFFTKPDVTFPNRNYQMLFVNRRYVRDKGVSSAIENAFRGLMPPGRHAMAILLVDLPAASVDVNVHPTKAEVRFESPQDIFSLVYRTVREGLGPQAALPEFPSARSADAEPPGMMDPVVNRKSPLLSSQPMQSAIGFAPPDPVLSRAPEVTDETVMQGWTMQSDPFEHASDPMAGVRILGQFYETFIMAEFYGEPVFIDQHVASERIIYNRLRKAGITPSAQMLLMPEPVELPRDIHAILMRNLKAVRNAGIELEPFGERAFVIRSAVHNTRADDPVELLSALAAELETTHGRLPENALLDRMITTASCKMAIKAGQRLTHEEMHALVSDLLKTEFNRTCPHGRPIIHSITLDTLKGWFKR